MNPPFDSKIKDRFLNSRNILVLTGAGISAESGVPTFRGQDGLWKNFRAEDLATPEAFRKNPVLVWEWYLWRMELISQKDPNPAHFALVEWERRLPDFYLVTQNVDGLHRRAGSSRLLEIHGNIFHYRCISCGKEGETKLPQTNPRPTCGECGSLLRPAVLWFGENYDRKLLDAATDRAESSDFTLVIGSSGMVGVPVELARISKENGAFVLEINLDPSGYSKHADVFLSGKAGQILPALTEWLFT